MPTCTVIQSCTWLFNKVATLELGVGGGESIESRGHMARVASATDYNASTDCSAGLYRCWDLWRAASRDCCLSEYLRSSVETFVASPTVSHRLPASQRQ